MTYRLKRSLSGKKLTYNQLKTLMNCEGVVLKKHAGFTRYEPTTTYIWFDKQGNSFDATAYDK